MDRRVLGFYVLAGLFLLHILVEALVRTTGVVSGVEPLLGPGEYAAGVVVVLPFVATLCYVGWWVSRSGLDPARYRRIWMWVGAGAVAGVGVFAVVATAFQPASALALIGWLRTLLVTGCGLGVTIGTVEARAIQHAVIAERTQVEKQRVKQQRDMLQYLNGVLRHEVLNAANVVAGYVGLIRADADSDESAHQRAEIAHRHVRDIESIIEDIRSLLSTFQGRKEFTPRSIDAVLDECFTRLRDMEPAAEIRRTGATSARVLGDDLLERVFWNLLSNAVEHSQNGRPVVEVTVIDTGPEVTVLVRDNGPGIDPGVRETIFEQPDGDRKGDEFGLYLTRRLVDGYGGDLTLVETGPEGTTFAVSLPTPERGGGVDASVRTAAE